MSKIVKLKVFLAVLITLPGCQKLKPEKVAIPDYPDLNTFYLNQASLLNNTKLMKSVRLDKKTEENQFEMDSSKWKEELSFLTEMNPSQPEYVGVFAVETVNNNTLLTLKDGERGILKRLEISKTGEEISAIQATIHEDKDVYVHHREIQVSINDGLINNFKIIGYQKMMLKDTVRFGIEGKALD